MDEYNWEDIEWSILFIEHLILNYTTDDKYAVWFYAGEENELLEQCISLIPLYMQKKAINKILLITDYDVSENGPLVEIVKIKSDEMKKLTDWYRICCETAEKFVYISKNKPIGRCGEELMEKFKEINLENFCKIGLLHIKD